MTTPVSRERRRIDWVEFGQSVGGTTLLVLIAGAVAAFAQYPIEYQQAATNATLSAQISALSERVGKIESQLNFVLMGIVGAVITQIIVLKTSKKP